MEIPSVPPLLSGISASKGGGTVEVISPDTYIVQQKILSFTPLCVMISKKDDVFSQKCLLT